jgi:hypothetical protein
VKTTNLTAGIIILRLMVRELGKNVMGSVPVVQNDKVMRTP